MRPLLVLAALAAALAAQPRDPARLLADPALLAHPESLPGTGGETAMVFRGEPGTSGFNLHSYIARHDGLFWVIWSSSRVREEDPDQLVRYATSRDGLRWTPAQVLAGDPEGPGRWIARGLYIEGGRLQALAALVESADYRNRGRGEVWKNLKLMRFEWTGKAWRERGVFAADCMNNFPPVRLGGSYAMPCRDSFMNVFMALAASPGAHAWSRTPLAAAPPFDRMDEPTLYDGTDGHTHLIVRDNRRSGRLIHSVSTDRGRTWSQPVLTNYPDATSKNFAGRLADGRFFLINNPDPRRRDPLAVSFSPDGWEYARPAAIRKGGATFQYPHAVEHSGSLWVVYSTGKRDIEITRVIPAR